MLIVFQCLFAVCISSLVISSLSSQIFGQFEKLVSCISYWILQVLHIVCLEVHYLIFKYFLCGLLFIFLVVFFNENFLILVKSKFQFSLMNFTFGDLFRKYFQNEGQRVSYIFLSSFYNFYFSFRSKSYFWVNFFTCYQVWI